MADGPRKFLAEREIAEAQDAMLGGKLSGSQCILAKRGKRKACPKPRIQGRCSQLRTQVRRYNHRPKPHKKPRRSRRGIGNRERRVLGLQKSPTA